MGVNVVGAMFAHHIQPLQLQWMESIITWNWNAAIANWQAPVINAQVDQYALHPNSNTFYGWNNKYSANTPIQWGNLNEAQAEQEIARHGLAWNIRIQDNPAIALGQNRARGIQFQINVVRQPPIPALPIRFSLLQAESPRGNINLFWNGFRTVPQLQAALP